MSDTRFLFVVAEAPDATVIDSQVVDAIVAVGREGFPFDLLFYAEPRPFLQKRRYYARRRAEIAARTDWSALFASRVARRHPGLRYLFDRRGDGPAEFRLHDERVGMPSAEIERKVQEMLRIRASQCCRSSPRSRRRRSFLGVLDSRVAWNRSGNLRCDSANAAGWCRHRTRAPRSRRYPAAFAAGRDRSRGAGGAASVAGEAK
jgi:hypothetical protein